MPKVTVEQYAKHRKISVRSIRQYLAENLFPEAVSREGRRIVIDQAAADKAMNRRATTRQQLLEGRMLPTKATQEVKLQTTEKAGTSGLSFHEARTLSQRYKAALLKIELDEKTGRLVDSEAVKIAAFNKARAVRDALLNVSDRISPILAAENDQSKIADILTKEIRQALEELSR